MKQSFEVEPSSKFLTSVLSLLTIGGLLSSFYLKTLRPIGMRTLLSKFGVALHKCKKAAQEVDRKTFHLCGLLVPLIYQLLLEVGWTKQDCMRLTWSLTTIGWIMDLLRIYTPLGPKVFPAFMIKILRDKERTQLAGACYFSLGCSLTISIFPPSIAMVSILNLVLGDLSAAIIGVSFGGETCTVRVGRESKKSVEGSVAMFIVCFIVGCFVFAEVHLREYAVFFGSFVATLTELYEPFKLNDNLTIPVMSGVAMIYAFHRIQCI
eukprot:c15428_g1_i1.p1 GENE.c15428_g1_i1~~c15428_g1_i1.p1  ORF type:complete len:277 (-),score=44.33 c15428_g1_i1:152-946(-)